MEPSEPLYQKLKIHKLKNKQLFIFDKLTNNLPDVFDPFFLPLKEQNNHNSWRSPGGHNNIYLIFQKQIHKCWFGSNSIKTKSTKDWNEIIHKLQLRTSF